MRSVSDVSSKKRRASCNDKTTISSNSDNNNYKDATKALSELQSNSQTVAKSVAENDANSKQNIPDVIEFLNRANLSLEDVDRLSVVHVSGTKGKGSTCALVESILRHHGYRTGLYTSPHLIEVRERIRINEQPLSHDVFTKYFWHIYDKLIDTKPQYNDKMPAYFRFLTIMAIYTFLQEDVDVAIFEVGIGGEYDCTNVIRSPVVCGVTSLGIDHTQLLGNTLESIAWHKAGIFKPGVPAVTAPQKSVAMHVLEQRAIEKQAVLHTAPPISLYPSSENVEIGVQGKFQRMNAALAIQLANIWLHNHDKEPSQRKWLNRSQFTNTLDTFNISTQTLLGLKNCRWPGRDQILKFPNMTLYLDGAHTLESIEQCVDWFMTSSKQESVSLKQKVKRVLLFNLTGGRDFCSFFPFLGECNFDYVIFCPNYQYAGSTAPDLTLMGVSCTTALQRCHRMKEQWDTFFLRSNELYNNAENVKLEDEYNEKTNLSVTNFSNSSLSLTSSNTNSSDTKTTNRIDRIPTKGTTLVFPCIEDSFNWLYKGRSSDSDLGTSDTVIPPIHTDYHIQLLVTGSLHLVGAVLGYLEPNCVNKVSL